MIKYPAYIKVKKFLIVSVLVWGIMVFGFSAGTSAMPYQPDGTIRIITHGSPQDADSGDDAIEWQVETKKTGPGSAILSFKMTGADQPFCRLDIKASDSGLGNAPFVSLLWNDPDRRPQVIQQADLLIVPGSPVPCDMLPLDMVTGKNESRNYEIKREVSGQTFVDNFQVTCSGIDNAAARKNGWLTGEDQPGKLVMITVINARTNALVVRQLWATGADWWIFEETPYYQSWQVR